MKTELGTAALPKDCKSQRIGHYVPHTTCKLLDLFPDIVKIIQ
jgi:hypothetical protein